MNRPCRFGDGPKRVRRCRVLLVLECLLGIPVSTSTFHWGRRTPPPGPTSTHPPPPRPSTVTLPPRSRPDPDTGGRPRRTLRVTNALDTTTRDRPTRSVMAPPSTSFVLSPGGSRVPGPTVCRRSDPGRTPPRLRLQSAPLVPVVLPYTTPSSGSFTRRTPLPLPLRLLGTPVPGSRQTPDGTGRDPRGPGPRKTSPRFDRGVAFPSSRRRSRRHRTHGPPSRIPPHPRSGIDLSDGFAWCRTRTVLGPRSLPRARHHSCPVLSSGPLRPTPATPSAHPPSGTLRTRDPRRVPPRPGRSFPAGLP